MSYSTSDQALLNEVFSSKSNSTHRAVTSTFQEGYKSYASTIESNPTKEISTGEHSKDVKRNPTPKVSLWQVSDTTFLDYHVMLRPTVTPEEAFSFLCGQVVDITGGFKNHREFPKEKKIVGWNLDETREGCYRVELFNLNEELGINCTRLDGHAMAISNLWNTLRERLSAQDLTVEEMDLMGETDDEGFFSSDDDDDFNLDLDSFKFLSLSQDPTFVERLISEIEDVNIGTNSLMLLAFNCRERSNLEFIMQNYGQEVFDKIVARLADAEYQVSLPAAACAAQLIYSLFGETTVEVDTEQMKTILNTIEFWGHEDQSRKTVIPTASEQASGLLSQVLGEVQRCTTDPYDFNQDLKQILETTDFESVRDNVQNFLLSN